MAIGAEVSSYQIPTSRGVPNSVRWLFIIGVALIVFMGAITIVQAGENHYWPAQDTTKIDLSGNL